MRKSFTQILLKCYLNPINIVINLSSTIKAMNIISLINSINRRTTVIDLIIIRVLLQIKTNPNQSRKFHKGS